MARVGQYAATGLLCSTVPLVAILLVSCSLDRFPLDVPNVDGAAGAAADLGNVEAGPPGDGSVESSGDAEGEDASNPLVVIDGGNPNATEATHDGVVPTEGDAATPFDAMVPGEPMPLGDAMVPGDATVLPRPDGGTVASIECAPSTVCELPATYCCRCSDGPTCFIQGMCWPAAAPCVGQAILCDDSADCGGASCCAHFTSGLFFGATCEPFCSAGEDVQLCASDQECAAPATCKPLDSLPPFSACQ